MYAQFFTGIPNISLAERIKFSTTWGVLIVRSNYGIHHNGTYGKNYTDIIMQKLGILPAFGISPIEEKCTSKREGTPYRGTVEYTVNSSETAFTGVWGYCAESPTHKWSGTLK